TMGGIQSERAAPGSMCGTAAQSIIRWPGSARWAPVTMRISVDLPGPFPPTRACTSPARRSNGTPRSARTPANDLVMRTASSTASLTLLLASLTLLLASLTVLLASLTVLLASLTVLLASLTVLLASLTVLPCFADGAARFADGAALFR